MDADPGLGQGAGGAEPQQPPPQNQDPEIVGNIFSAFITGLQQYGWFVVVGIAVLLYLRSKFQPRIQQWQSQREAASYKKMDGNKAQERMEAMEKARLRMQEQLDQQARDFTLKQQQREEEKRQERIQDWDNHQQGKGYRNKTKGSSDGTQASSSSSSTSKPASDQPKKRLKPEYNPLMGATADVCRFRPSPRGGASGGG